MKIENIVSLTVLSVVMKILLEICRMYHVPSNTIFIKFDKMIHGSDIFHFHNLKKNTMEIPEFLTNSGIWHVHVHTEETEDNIYKTNII